MTEFVSRASARALALARFGQCHRIPERCLRFRGKPLPMCARCFGVMAGHIAALVLVMTGTVLPLWAWGGCVVIGFADWAAQELLGVTSTNFRRVVTGALGGFAIGVPFWMAILAAMT